MFMSNYLEYLIFILFNIIAIHYLFEPANDASSTLILLFRE